MRRAFAAKLEVEAVKQGLDVLRTDVKVGLHVIAVCTASQSFGVFVGKDPDDCSVKELKEAIRRGGMRKKAVGMTEKHELVKLCRDNSLCSSQLDGSVKLHDSVDLNMESVVRFIAYLRTLDHESQFLLQAKSKVQGELFSMCGRFMYLLNIIRMEAGFVILDRTGDRKSVV